MRFFVYECRGTIPAVGVLHWLRRKTLALLIAQLLRVLAWPAQRMLGSVPTKAQTMCGTLIPVIRRQGAEVQIILV